MSEDDRAAKAARAKAMLKKRQQQKKTGIENASPAFSPPARTFSPAFSESVEQDNNHDLGDVFAKNEQDTSWLSSLPRAPSPPSRTQHSTLLRSPTNSTLANGKGVPSQETESLQKESQLIVEQNARLKELEKDLVNTNTLLSEERDRASGLDVQLQTLEVEKETALQQEKQTISLLVTEKSSLLTELQHLQDADHRAQDFEAKLLEERRKSENLHNEVVQLQKEIENVQHVAQEAQAKEKELHEKARDQERQLQLEIAASSESRKKADQYSRKLRDLEEQIQNDDRVERLEISLKNTQDRGDELEFQLSKSKQAYAALKTEYDEIQSLYNSYTEKEATFSAESSALKDQLSSAQEQLATLLSEKQLLVEEKAELSRTVDNNLSTIRDIQTRSLKAANEVAEVTRQLQACQRDLKNANRRAQDAEKIQQNLQAEGSSLMRSLEEMRPKIIELTSVKLELAERVEGLEHTLHTRDASISKLEAQLGAAQDRMQHSETELQQTMAHLDEELNQTRESLAEFQESHTQLQEELDTALTSLRNMDVERTNLRTETSHRIAEIDKLNVSNRAQGEEISKLRSQLNLQQQTQAEEKESLRHAREEINNLRLTISTKEVEIEHLRKHASSESKAQSLDNEMMDSLKQRHILEMSESQSRIRALENSLFDAEAKVHASQIRINALEEQLRLPQNMARSFSPIPSHIPSRPSSRAQHDSDLRRSSFGSQRPSNLTSSLSRSVLEQALSPETLHKRKVSLSMLKARIDSEIAANSPHPLSRALSPVHSDRGSATPPPKTLQYRPQFLDESHVFWCHSCRGDLVVL